MSAETNKDNTTTRSNSVNSDVSISNDNGHGDKNTLPRDEHRLLFIDRGGSGDIWWMLLNEERTEFQSYKIHTNSWSCIKDVSNFAAIVLNNKLYMVGGFNQKNATYVKRTLRYDPITEEWEKLADLPRGKAKHALNVVGKRLLVTGGEVDGQKLTSSCEYYNPDENKWVSAPSLLAPRANHAVGELNGSLYLSGGLYEKTGHDNLWVFENNRWQELDPDYPLRLQVKVDRHVMYCSENSIHFIGGVVHDEYIEDYTEKVIKFCRTREKMETFKPRITYSKSELLSPWERSVTGMNHPRHSAAYCVIGDYLYVFGGSTVEHGATVNTSEYYDVASKSWVEDFSLPRKKGNFSNISCCMLKYVIVPELFPSRVPKKWVFW